MIHKGNWISLPSFWIILGSVTFELLTSKSNHVHLDLVKFSKTVYKILVGDNC